jgi:hypothetical protein
MIAEETIPLSNFELIQKNINDENNTDDIQDELNIDTRFIKVLKENEELNILSEELISDIDNIKQDSESINKNMAFKSILTTLRIAVNEYKYQKILCERCIKSYSEMCNEENVVKILELIRTVISDRRIILNDITNNLLKLQRLSNERKKLDMVSGEDDDDIDRMVTPDTL